MLFGLNAACVLTLIDVAVCRPPLLQTQITHTSGYYRLGGVRQQHTTLHKFLVFSFASCSFLTSSPPSQPPRFAESSGTYYELTDGNGMTGVERRASEGASEGGFIYSGKRRRGRALQRRSQPSIPSADGKHVCSGKTHSDVPVAVCVHYLLLFSFQETEATLTHTGRVRPAIVPVGSDEASCGNLPFKAVDDG